MRVRIFLTETEYTMENVRFYPHEQLVSSGSLEVWPFPCEFTDIGDYTEEFRAYVGHPVSTAESS